MLTIVDYGVGNLFSLSCSLKKVGSPCRISSDPAEIADSDGVILPGVGAFEDAAMKLRMTGLGDVLRDYAASGRPLLGICLGMQLLFEDSFEFGHHAGLGLIPGSVRSLAERTQGLKIPHMGWNRLDITRPGGILSGLKGESYMYFVHSFYADCPREFVTSTAEYGFDVMASVQRGNVYGCQFHPEKSSEAGLAILRQFCAIAKEGTA